MSAFIVEDKTINRVIGWLAHPRIRHEHPYLLEDVLEAAEIEKDAADWPERLGLSMMQMNCDAVDARYDEHNLVAYQYRQEWATTDVQALKSLGCWLYQCSEGEVPERPLYRAFRELEGRIALYIVHRMDAYEKAVWA